MIGWRQAPVLHPGRTRGEPPSYLRGTCQRGRPWHPWSPQCVQPATSVGDKRGEGGINGGDGHIQYSVNREAQTVGLAGWGSHRCGGSATTHQRYCYSSVSISRKCTYKGEQARPVAKGRWQKANPSTRQIELDVPRRARCRHTALV